MKGLGRSTVASWFFETCLIQWNIYKKNECFCHFSEQRKETHVEVEHKHKKRSKKKRGKGNEKLTNSSIEASLQKELELALEASLQKVV